VIYACGYGFSIAYLADGLKSLDIGVRGQERRRIQSIRWGIFDILENRHLS
jgi:hypothetical protein